MLIQKIVQIFRTVGDVLNDITSDVFFYTIFVKVT